MATFSIPDVRSILHWRQMLLLMGVLAGLVLGAPGGAWAGRSALNRGHEHHRSIRHFRACEGRPRRFGGAQRESGTRNDSSSRTVQQ
jgi:hypothetical protein